MNIDQLFADVQSRGGILVGPDGSPIFTAGDMRQALASGTPISAFQVLGAVGDVGPDGTYGRYRSDLSGTPDDIQAGPEDFRQVSERDAGWFNQTGMPLIGAGMVAYGMAPALAGGGAAEGGTLAATDAAATGAATPVGDALAGGATTMGGEAAAAGGAGAAGAAGAGGTAAATDASTGFFSKVASAVAPVAKALVSNTPTTKDDVTGAAIQAGLGATGNAALYNKTQQLADDIKGQAANVGLPGYTVEGPQGTTSIDPVTHKVTITPNAANQGIIDTNNRAAQGFSDQVASRSTQTPEALGQADFDRYLAYARPKQAQALDATVAQQIGSGALGNIGSGYGNAALKAFDTAVADSDYKSFTDAINNALGRTKMLQDSAAAALGLSQSAATGADYSRTALATAQAEQNANKDKADLVVQGGKVAATGAANAIGATTTGLSRAASGINWDKMLGSVGDSTSQTPQTTGPVVRDENGIAQDDTYDPAVQQEAKPQWSMDYPDGEDPAAGFFA